ncbi:glycosyltransferase family protein [Actinomarinicola tropica]|uniref:YfhO family protein n=1 Tax=Actinomarinicola tropica TaxID=2789776 RepID=A0A5Q2RH68_9ACTN|nr:hypothetical protein [Actinomarinicola tropica]QGG96179.1 hypothetical protein GH723_14310 [Actinomarinicola tropica]
MGGTTGQRERAAFAVAVLVLVAWGLHWLWGPGLPPGVDTTGHLTRLEVGVDLLASGRLDGWFDRAMLGYQTHLMYGPGLALAVGALRLVTFGLLSTAGAYELVGVLALVAVVPATAALARSLRVPLAGARAAGVLALAVSSGRGGGIEGAFDLGLMPNHMAVPLVVLAWAWMADDRPRPLGLGLVVGAVALTHPQSLVALVLFAPLVLLTGWVVGSVRSVPWWLVGAAATAAGSTAWWWVPAVLHRDLRGVLTSWDLPTFAEHVHLVVEGRRGWIGWAALLVVLAWPAGLALGILARDRALVALAMLPVAALALLHAIEALLVDRFPEAVMLPNRGFAYACLLAAPLVGDVLGRAAGARPAAAWAAAAVAVAVTMPALRPPDGVFDRPVPGMRAAAEDLAARVPEGRRFAYVESDVDQPGVVAPGRWLGWASGATNLGPFGAEFAPGVGPTLMVFEPPDVETVDRWVARARQLGVSHLVSGDPGTREVLAAARELDLVVTHPPVAIWEVGGRMPFAVVEARAEEVTLSIPPGHPTTVPVAIGYHPGWSARVDGRTVTTGEDPHGILTVQVPAGPQEVELTWSEPSGHGLGRWLTVGAAVALGAIRLRRRHRPGSLRA